MGRRSTLLSIAVVAVCLSITADAAETLRNPPGTSASPATSRNPAGTGAAPERGDRKAEPTIPSEPTRTPRGSDTSAPPPRQAFGAAGPRPNVPQGTSPGTVGLGGTAPNTFNPAGANGSAFPQGTGASRPNGGAPESGSKAAPMQANGVRKVD